MKLGMKIESLLALLLGWAVFTQAGPSEMNFQGVLLDGSGNGVTGTRAMTLKLHDAAIGGNLLYTEDLGNVSVNKGVYSFNFGMNGTGNPKVTETVTVADGTNSTFQKILANTNVVSGSVSVTDGTYNWDQINGPSDGGVNFDASYSSALRRITVNYYNGAPPAGRIVRVTYRSPSAGLAGILTNENDPWIEVAVNGISQSPRQKINAVPFALRATKVDSVDVSNFQETVEVDFPIKRFHESWGGGGGHFINLSNHLPNGLNASGTVYYKNLAYDVPFFVREILSLSVNYSVLQSGSSVGQMEFYLADSIGQTQVSFNFPRVQTNSSFVTIPINLKIPTGESFKIVFNIVPGSTSGGAYGGGYINSVTARVKALKSMGFQ